MPLHCPTCPSCHQPPLLVVGGRQAICRTGDCDVFAWDPLTPDGNPIAAPTPVRLLDR